jgi:hypothetical protein
MNIYQLPPGFSLCRDHIFKAVFTKDTPQSRGAITGLLSAFLGRKLSLLSITTNEPAVDDLRQRNIKPQRRTKAHEEYEITPNSIPLCAFFAFVVKSYCIKMFRTEHWPAFMQARRSMAAAGLSMTSTAPGRYQLPIREISSKTTNGFTGFLTTTQSGAFHWVD